MARIQPKVAGSSTVQKLFSFSSPSLLALTFAAAVATFACTSPTTDDTDAGSVADDSDGGATSQWELQLQGTTFADFSGDSVVAYVDENGLLIWVTDQPLVCGEEPAANEPLLTVQFVGVSGNDFGFPGEGEYAVGASVGDNTVNITFQNQACNLGTAVGAVSGVGTIDDDSADVSGSAQVEFTDGSLSVSFALVLCEGDAPFFSFAPCS